MKRCLFKIKPRQSGKTINLIRLYQELSNDRETIYPVIMVVHNQADKERHFKSVNNIYTVQEILYKINSQIAYKESLKCSHLILDEYFGYTELQQAILYKKMKDLVVENVWIETSPVRQFDKKIVDFCRYIKSIENLYLHDVLCKVEFIDDATSKDFTYLYDNYITDPLTTIHYEYGLRKSICSKETFETEFLGKFYKEEQNV